MSGAKDSGSEPRNLPNKHGTVSLDQTYMKAKVDAGELGRAASAVDAIANKVRMHFEEDRIRLEGMDPACVAVVDAEVTDIEWETDMGPLTIGVQTEELLSGVRNPPSGNDMRLRVNDGEDELKVLKGPLMSYVPIETTTDIRDLPDTSEWEHEATAEADAMKFKGAVGAVSCAASHGVRLVAGHEGLKAESKDWSTGEYEHEWPIHSENTGEIASNLFSEGYLGSITDAIHPEGTVSVHLSEEYPVRIVSDNVEFLLAPRIQADSQEDL